MAELISPVPRAAYMAATQALDEYKTPLLSDPQLKTARMAAIAVTAAAPLIQQRAFREMVTVKRLLAVVVQSFIAVSLTWGTLAAVALTAHGWLRTLAIAALVFNIYAYASSKRFTRAAKKRAAELLDEADGTPEVGHG